MESYLSAFALGLQCLNYFMSLPCRWRSTPEIHDIDSGQQWEGAFALGWTPQKPLETGPYPGTFLLQRTFPVCLQCSRTSLSFGLTTSPPRYQWFQIIFSLLLSIVFLNKICDIYLGIQRQAWSPFRSWKCIVCTSVHRCVHICLEQCGTVLKDIYCQQ